jgi:aminoglycoside phosphotransferase (APT) family kinase protein
MTEPDGRAAGAESMEELAARATEAALAVTPRARVDAVEVLAGGHSSLTYAAVLTGAGPVDRAIVLKVAPAGLEPSRNRDVLRQARLLLRLAREPGVRVPAVLFASAGDPPAVPPFFAMEFVDGDSIEPLVDPAGDVSAATLAARARAAARMLAALHAVTLDPSEFAAEPATDLDTEVDRWCRSFASVDADLRLDGLALGERLRATAPTTGRPVLVHGDYRLGNMRSVDSTIRAVLDWEIWSLGDGRIDLAWLLLMLDAGYVQRQRDVAGLPSTASLVREYEAAGGAPVVDLDWFHALVRFKQAAATALITKRARRHGGDGFPATIVNLLEATRACLDEHVGAHHNRPVGA